MSGIYIQEPPTSGKILLKTSAGDIDIELWSRECPKACRNFIQLCMEGYYNNTIFHRVAKGFIVQGGDPKGDGTGGESIYGAPFKDEFHSRLRYTRRGLVGMATADKNDNGSQFFFTMGPTSELQNKNTLFGKVTGDTLFNMLKLEDGLIDHNERPMYPHKILEAVILNNPFDDIVPRERPKQIEIYFEKPKEKGVKNFGLLSFGDEAEEDELETTEFTQKNVGKAKSLHDAVDDPNLSKEPININLDNAFNKQKNVKENNTDETSEDEVCLHMINSEMEEKISSNLEKSTIENDVHSEEDDDTILKPNATYLQIQKEKEKEKIRKDIKLLKKQYQIEKRARERIMEESKSNDKKKKTPLIYDDNNDFRKQYLEEKEKYEKRRNQMPLKGSDREELTLNLLSKFRAKLQTIKQKYTNEEERSFKMDDKSVEHDILSDNWLCHVLRSEKEMPVLAKDASTKDDDWYDVYDPRNPLNKRKRKEDKSNISKHYKRK